MSYLQIKKFLDEQISLFNTPVVIDDNMRSLLHEENITESQMKSVLFKCNLLLKRHNRTKFRKQVVHQIVQQVTKAEQENLTQVNEALSEVSKIGRPVMTDQFAVSASLADRNKLLNNIADILPEGRYLFAVKRDNELDTSSANSIRRSGETESHPLVRDNAELVESPENKALREVYSEETEKRLEKKLGAQLEHREVLRQKYDDFRKKLARLNEEVVYKMQKLAYIKALDEKMDFTENEGRRCGNDSDNEVENLCSANHSLKNVGTNELGTQMDRFNILVEKLEFALASE